MSRLMERIKAGFKDWPDLIEDRPLVVSVSGGKDSTAMALWMIEEGLQDRCTFVFADTKWEHPDLYQYIDEVLEPLLGKIHRVTSAKYPGGMVDMVKQRGAFPARIYRFCTEHLKINPLKLFMDNFEAETGLDPINCVGIRAAESVRRSKFEMWENGGPMRCDTWRPLIDWLVADVVEIHNRHGVPPCPLYLRETNASSRVGCYPCIMSRKSEIRAVAEADPWRIDQIRQLEAEVGDAMEARLEAKGQTLEELGRARPGYFQSRDGKDGKTWPIDKVVEWAKTSKGGKQFELFTADEPGCQMWGLCDLGDNDNAD